MGTDIGNSCNSYQKIILPKEYCQLKRDKGLTISVSPLIYLFEKKPKLKPFLFALSIFFYWWHFDQEINRDGDIAGSIGFFEKQSKNYYYYE